MLDEIYDIDKSLTEDDYYDALLYLLGDAYPDLDEEELEDMLEDMLDQLPDQYAENILNTVGTIGKQIGSGALKFTAKNPALVKGALTVAGTAIGGPIGAKIGSGVGNLLTKTTQNKMMPETGKMLSLMQNPQAQAAMALGSMGVGNGVAPLAVNKNTAPMPTALYLRAMISVAQSALKELDRNNVIPPAEYYESLPFNDDVDRQAEWLVEQLVEDYYKVPPFELNHNTYFIYSNGEIERYHMNDKETLVYCFVDDRKNYHVLGSFEVNKVQSWRSNKKNNLIELVYIKSFSPFNSSMLNLGVKVWDSESYKGKITRRYYVNPDCLAGLFGAMAENNIEDLRFSGASKADGSPEPSVSHINGENFDLGYLRMDKSGNGCTVTDPNFDINRQIDFNNSLFKFGFARTQNMLSKSFKLFNKLTLLPHTDSHIDHFDHLHVQGFDHDLIKHISPISSKPSIFNAYTLIGNTGVLENPQVSKKFDIYKINQI